MLDGGREHLLPGFLEPLANAMAKPPVLLGIGVLSVAMFVGSVLAIPYCLKHLPPDFPSHGGRFSQPGARPSPGKLALRVLKNLLGLLLLGIGLLMLVLPGQGVLTIVVALVLLDFPGKPRIIRRIFASKQVLEVANRMRKRAGQAPFEPPAERASQP